MDPEAEFLASERKTGHEWELFKENVRPLKRGRNVEILNNALNSHRDHLLKKSLLEERRRMIEAIDEYQGDDPLHPWLQCIKWVQEYFPAHDECSGIIVIYEQCVRTFWHDEHYKNDLRYLKVWIEYAENCSDAEVIYRFLDANNIGQSHALFYISYALHTEAKNKMNKSDQIYNLGICRKAQPLSKLEDKYRKFILRLTRRNKAGEEVEAEDQQSVARTFGTLLSTDESRVPLENIPVNVGKKAKIQRTESNGPIAIFDENMLAPRNQPGIPRKEPKVWNTLGYRHDRNKENEPIPSIWTSYKVPQKPGSRSVHPTACIQVFVDEECTQTQAPSRIGRVKPSTKMLRRANSQSLKRDSELLKDDPLRNFPSNSLPR